MRDNPDRGGLMAEKTHVLVAGAGVAGAAVAYFLAKEGVSSLLVERDSIASHSSGFSFGMANPLEGSGLPEPLLPLTLVAARMHEELARELKETTGIDTSYRRMLHLTLALNEQEAEELQGDLAWQQKTGLGVRWLGAEEVRSREPRVADGVVGAVEISDMAMMDSYRYTLALVEGAEKLGARLVYGEVIGLEREDARFRVKLSRGQEVEAEKVVLAMGPWTGSGPSKWLGFSVPVEPLRGQILRLELEDPPLECCLGRSGSYIGPKADGLVWAGTTEEHAGFDENPTAEGQESIIQNLLTMAPALAEARLVQQTACLRPLSSDNLPIIGEVPGWHGVYLATGAGRKGLLLSPPMGQAVCDLIVRGKTDVPLEFASPLRFSP